MPQAFVIFDLTYLGLIATMQRTSFAERDCPVAQALEVVGDWWTLLILWNAFCGLRRFDEFQAQLGIARNILARRLKQLVANGVIEEQPYSERPRRVEYRLTEQGQELFPVIAALFDWGTKYSDRETTRQLKIVHADTGDAIEPQAVCGRRGIKLDPTMVRVANPGGMVDIRHLRAS